MNITYFKKIIKEILVLLILLVILSGCTGETNDNKIREKVSSEIDFFESEIFSILIKYAKGEYETDEGIDWKGIYEESEKLNESWSTVVLDLSQINIPQEQINALGEDVTNLVIAISQENETDVFTILYNMYSKLPDIERIYSNDVSNINKRELKRTVLSAYRLAEVKEFENSKNEIQNASDKYNEMINDIEYSKNNAYNLNKVLVELEELRAAIILENISLIRIRFVNFIEEL